MASSFVTCAFCRKAFSKDNRHINENKKLGHNSYCSLKCQYAFKTQQRELTCDNQDCKNKFKRAPHSISPHNFCNRSCAAIYNNMVRIVNKVGIKEACKIKARRLLTQEEKKAIKLAGSALGGMNRWLNFKSEFNKESIILAIQNFVDKNSRLPVKREMNRFYRPTRFYFGTWNHAVEAAGFKPNPVMFADKCTANDGHACDSIAEKTIDDYLYGKGINHDRDTFYPGGIYKADFKIGRRIIEYFGLSGELKRYDELKEIKKKLAKRYKLNLVEIYPKDLYPKNKLGTILSL